MDYEIFVYYLSITIIILFLIMTAYAVRRYLTSERLSQFIELRGSVTKFEFDHENGKFIVEYRYHYNGRDYKGANYAPYNKINGYTMIDYIEAKKKISKSNDITIFIDNRNHSHSLIDRTADTNSLKLLILFMVGITLYISYDFYQRTLHGGY
jgi:hypothetical protein